MLQELINNFLFIFLILLKGHLQVAEFSCKNLIFRLKYSKGK